MHTQIFSKKDLRDEALKKIADLLAESKVIAFPTETVYGLGAHVFKEDAIDKIYTLKNRPKDKGLIVHLGKIEDVKKVAKDIPQIFYILAKKFFPGPLTIILKKRESVLSNISIGSTLAVRMPASLYTLKLINYLGDPIVGTSANLSGAKSPISAKEVIKTFSGKIEIIMDTGICPIKIPSTIISLEHYPYKILREGKISKDEIDEALRSANYDI